MLVASRSRPIGFFTSRALLMTMPGNHQIIHRTHFFDYSIPYSSFNYSHFDLDDVLRRNQHCWMRTRILVVVVPPTVEKRSLHTIYYYSVMVVLAVPGDPNKMVE